MSTLEELILELPLDLQQEVEDFVRFLLARHARQGPGQVKAGTARDLREQYTSSGKIRTLPDLVQSLPSEMQQQVQEFIEFLLEKQSHPPAGQFKLDWRGALRELRDQYTSVELQHKIAEWREED